MKYLRFQNYRGLQVKKAIFLKYKKNSLWLQNHYSSYLSEIYSAGIDTDTYKCRLSGFTGPVPPPLLIRKQTINFSKEFFIS